MVSKRRRRGDGTIGIDKAQTLRDGRTVYFAKISLGVIINPETGRPKRIRKKVTGHSEREVRGELEELKRQYAIGVDVTNQTLDQYLRTWLERHRDVRPSTIATYRIHVETHISPLLGGIKVLKLRAHDVDRLIARLMDSGKKPATIQHVVTTLRIALNDGVHRREIARNVAADVKLPKVETEPIRPMTIDEAVAILDAVAGHWSEPIVRLLLDTGMRLGEACALNQGDVDQVERFIRLRKSKTKVHAVPISDEGLEAARLAVRKAPRVGPDEPLFFGPRKSRAGHRDRLQGWSVSHALPKLVVAKGLDRIHPHLLRHGLATLGLGAGFALPVIQMQLGHADTRMTARYAHVQPEAQRALVEAVGARIAAARHEREDAQTQGPAIGSAEATNT